MGRTTLTGAAEEPRHPTLNRVSQEERVASLWIIPQCHKVLIDPQACILHGEVYRFKGCGQLGFCKAATCLPSVAVDEM